MINEAEQYQYIGLTEINLVNTELAHFFMPRPPKDIVELIAEITHRHVLRILYTEERMIGADIGRKLERFSGIRFKSTSSLSEALGRLEKEGMITKTDNIYALAEKSKKEWIVKFLNLLVKAKIDNGNIIKS